MTLLTPPRPSTEETDGRRRRSIDSRARVVAAMLELVREGDVAPGSEKVAARAKVGLRTVFRHFKDLDSLYREMSGVIEAELAAALAMPLTATDWRARLVELIHKRGLVFEKIAPFTLASNVHRHQSAFLTAAHARIVSAGRRTLGEVTPPAVREDAELFEMLDLLLSFETWSRLRQEQGLSASRARDVIELAVRRMIASVADRAA